MNKYVFKQSGVLIGFYSYFNTTFKNSVLLQIAFKGVVGMGLLWTILILNLIVPTYTRM